MEAKNILITGANGLIGHELLKQLSESNIVYAVSRSKPDIINDNIHFIQFDFSKEWDASSLPNTIDVIYHLAQSEHFRDFPDKSVEIFNVNTNSTLNLLEYARKSGCTQFIYASSGGVYGNSDEGFSENSPIISNGNLGFYLSTKFCSELLVENYTNSFAIIIARFFFVYGERQGQGMLIPRLVENVINGNEINLQGEDGININPIYVSDAASALDSLLKLEGSHKFNIGGNEVLSLKQICDIIGKVVGEAPVYSTSDIDPKHLIGDTSKMNRLLSLPQYTFAQGIQNLIAHRK